MHSHHHSPLKRAFFMPFHVPVSLFHLSRTHYFPKMRGGHPAPARPKLLYILVTWIGALVAMSVLYGMSSYTGSLLIIAPFGATCVLIFGVPDSPLAQPRNVIGGHVIATALSLLFLQLLGDGWWVTALAVATVIAVMQLTRTLHPPAGADPLVVILSHASWNFLVVPVLLGAIILVLCATITNNFASDRHYPKYWW
jgi:CBS-domain-containing membrane protein